MLTSAGGQTTKSYVRGNRSLRRFPFSMPENNRKEERGVRKTVIWDVFSFLVVTAIVLTLTFVLN